MKAYEMGSDPKIWIWNGDIYPKSRGELDEDENEISTMFFGRIEIPLEFQITCEVYHTYPPIDW